MVHPSYQLNPGDMFQVDIEKVMYGTGQQKAPEGNKRLSENLAARKKKSEAFYATAISKAATKSSPEGGSPAKATTADGETVEAEATSPEQNAEDQSGSGGEKSTQAGLEALSEEEAWKVNNRALKYLLKDVKKILKNNPKELSAKEKKQLRLFRTDAKRFLSHPEDSTINVQELMRDLGLQMKSHELMRESFEKLTITTAPSTADEASSSSSSPEASLESETAQPEYNRQRQIDKGLEGLSEEQKEKALRIMGDSQLSRGEMRRLAELLTYDEENPIDDSKPYATPWRPRPFMSAFAFIPRYLEVNPNICAAVYLRHPVARKGMAEVPTPFSYLTSQLTHNWYLERG